MFLRRLELTSWNAVLMPPARAFIPATAPKAIRATTSAYSTRSWPSSRAITFLAVTSILSIRSFICFLLEGNPITHWGKCSIRQVEHHPFCRVYDPKVLVQGETRTYL